MNISIAIAAAAALFMVPLSSSAALVYTGDMSMGIAPAKTYGLVYDSVSNVTWTQDSTAYTTATGSVQVVWEDVTNEGADGLVPSFASGWKLPSLQEISGLYDQLPGSPGSNKTGTVFFGGGTKDFLSISTGNGGGGSWGFWTKDTSSPNWAMVFDFENEVSDWNNRQSQQYNKVWVLYPGRLDGQLPVPLPAALWLFLSGSGLLGLVARLSRRA